MAIPSKDNALFHVVAAGECWLHELVHESKLTTLVCDHFEYDRRGLHPFFRSLPTTIHIRANNAEQSSWLDAAAQLAAARVRARRLAAHLRSSTVLPRHSYFRRSVSTSSTRARPKDLSPPPKMPSSGSR